MSTSLPHLSPMLTRCLLLAVVLLLSAAPLHAHGAASDTTRWTIYMGGREAGVYKRWSEADGELRYFFEFEDRGRGPRFESRVRLGRHGMPVSIDAGGYDYFKAPLFARFVVQNDTARWETRDDSGSAPVAGPVEFSEGGVDDGLLVRAALANGGRMQVLPEGTIHVVRVGELRVTAGDSTRTIVQYELSGMGFEPRTTWLTDNGEYFGSGSSWFATVLPGWQDAIPQMITAQEQRGNARAAEVARRLSHRPATALAVRNVAVYDAERRSILRDQTVLVQGNRIRAVGPARSVRIPRGAEVIDGRGRTLIPGLWDMHAHVDVGDGLQQIAAGVTSVRDLGNDTARVLDLQRKWTSGEFIGPRLMTSGLIDGPGQFTAPTGLRVSTEQEARAAVDLLAQQGMEQVKVYSSLDPKLLPVIVEQAHRHGMRVSGHIPWPLVAEEAVRQGIDELQHINFVMLNFLGDTIDTRTPARFHVPARMSADLDLSSTRVQQFIQLLRERDIVVDPTLGVFEGMFTSRDGQVTPGFENVVDRMPPQVRQSMRGGGLPAPEGLDQQYRNSFARMLEMVALLHDAGVRIVPGTDDWAGFALHRELELYVQAGIPAADVLHLATLGAARVMGRDDRLGSIAVGKLADLVLVEGDPVASISDVRRTRLVMKDGVVYEPNALYAEVSVAPVP